MYVNFHTTKGIPVSMGGAFRHLGKDEAIKSVDRAIYMHKTAGATKTLLTRENIIISVTLFKMAGSANYRWTNEV